MTPTLTADQQSQILRWTKKLVQQNQRIRTMARSGYVSEGQRAKLIKEQQLKFCDFLKEL